MCFQTMDSDLVHTILSDRISDWARLLEGVVDVSSLLNTESTASLMGSPIVLPGCSTAELESLRALIDGSSIRPLSKDQWSSVLRVFMEWKKSDLAALAVEKLTPQLDPLEMLQFGLQYKVKGWVLHGCSNITQPKKHLDIAKLGEALGWKVAARVAEVARLTSETSKHQAIVVSDKTAICSKCSTSVGSPPRNRIIYSLYPRLSSSQGEKRAFSAYVIPSWSPYPKKVEGLAYSQREVEWSCGQCRGSLMYGGMDGTAVPFRITLSDLIPIFGLINNQNTVAHVFAEELRECF